MGLTMRTLLAWLLALALGVQGAAAVAMVHCGPSHHGSPAAQPMADAAGHGHHAQHDAAADEQADLDGLQADSSDAPATLQKCSACASCCTMSALWGPSLTPPVLPGADRPPVASVPGIEPVAASGPERPPRSVLA